MQAIPFCHAAARKSLAIAALWSLAHALPAAAIQEVCVQSNADLVDAINAVSQVPQNIKIKKGTYSLNNTGWATAWPYYRAQPGTIIGGGYTANCADRDIAAGNTVLTATLPVSFYMYGDLTLEGLTFQLDKGVTISAEGLNNGVGPGLVPGTQLVIRRDVFRQSGSDGSGTLDIFWALSPGDTGGARIIDSLFVNNTEPNGSCVLDINGGGGSPEFVMINNTVYENSGSGVCVGSFVGNISFVGRNNIFYGNTGTDLDAGTTNVELVRNTIGTFHGPTPNQETGTQHGDPTLNANYHPIQSPPSAAINTGEPVGSADLPNRDLDGGPRVVGTRVDRGAYESTLDDNFILTVTNNNDSGLGSLRAAINSANNNGSGLIKFAIAPGDCTTAPMVIQLATPLPTITSAVFINGYSQAGATTNTLYTGLDSRLCVILDGSAISGGANGLLTGPNSQLIVMGLGFSGFVDAAINLNGGSGHSVQGVRVGGAINGVSLAQSGYGVYVAATNVVIGGDDPADRNLFGDARIDGIRLLDTAADADIANNYVGMGWNLGNSAYTNRGNAQHGIFVFSANNQIHDNLIGFSGAAGIVLYGGTAARNVVEHNGIGTDYPRLAAANLGNGGFGVHIDNSAHDNKIRYNQIDNNAAGVRVVSGLGNSVRFNAMDKNSGLGIDIAGAGTTPNDDDNSLAALNLANRGLNHPVLTMATGAPLVPGIVKGTLATTPGDYYIDLYATADFLTPKGCDAPGGDVTELWVASQKVTVSAATQPVSFTVSTYPFGFAPPNQWHFTATATDADTNAYPGNTSEFSACIPMTNDRIFSDRFDPPPT